MTVDISALREGRGLRIRDDTEGEQFDLSTDRSVDPVPASTAAFDVPVDAAVAVEVTALHWPVITTAIVWQSGDVVQRATPQEVSDPLPPATYEVDVSPPSAKVYVRVPHGSVAARFDDDHTSLRFDGPTEVLVGVRSHHTRPAATVTTTDDPRDLLRAVSTFGSALKTHTPDRSWPTLRGHPPALERGAALDVPPAAEPPDTGVVVETPPDYASIFEAAPLAFYLGATLEPGPRPAVRAAGDRHVLDGDDGPDVRAALVHLFTLDAVVRAAGVFPFRTTQADELDARVDLDYEALFERPLDERTAAYFEVARSATAGLLDWHHTTDVGADSRHAVVLPHLVDELSLVRSPARADTTAAISPEPDALSEFYRPEARIRSTADSPPARTMVVPESPGTPGHAWVADDFPLDAAKPTLGSYTRSLATQPETTGLDVHVVYNDARLADDDLAGYDMHQVAETTVRTSADLTVRELRDALTGDVDLFHFVGHVTDAGMVCADGELDVRTLARTGVDAFILNGCRSYEQGMALVTAGSLGGVVTVDDVYDPEASRVGRDLALLLGAGFPLYGALSVLAHTEARDCRYSIVGNDAFALRRAATGVPNLYAFDTDAVDLGRDEIPVTSYYYPYAENGMGTLVTPSFTDEEALLATAGTRREYVKTSEFDRLLDVAGVPVIVDGDLRHTDDLTLADFE